MSQTILFDVLNGNSLFRDNLSINGDISSNILITSNSHLPNPQLSGYVHVNNLNVNSSFNILPAGMIMSSISSISPPGWLLCDGSYFLRTQYPNLYAAIQTRYGYTSPLNFRIPDYRGAFLRGAGTSSINSIYSGNLDGSQNDTFKSHTHIISINEHQHTTTKIYYDKGFYNGTYLSGPANTDGDHRSQFSGGGGARFGTATRDSGLYTGGARTNITLSNYGNSNETRPYNLGVYWYIKY